VNKAVVMQQWNSCISHSVITFVLHVLAFTMLLTPFCDKLLDNLSCINKLVELTVSHVHLVHILYISKTTVNLKHLVLINNRHRT
jgi:hypothetical protein